ncbi:MAG: hypothetical protein ACRDJN_11525 [Chloroflexota bacterium]
MSSSCGTARLVAISSTVPGGWWRAIEVLRLDQDGIKSVAAATLTRDGGARAARARCWWLVGAADRPT